MHTRTLGNGLQVSAIGLGCMGMSQSYGPNPGDRRQMMTVLRTPLNLASISSILPRFTDPLSMKN